MTDHTDYRALCAELVELLEVSEEWSGCTQPQALTRARTALAEQPVGPTDEELWEQYSDKDGDPEDWAWCRDYARAVLARWGNYPVKPDSSPANQPDPVAPTDEALLASVRHFYGDQAAADMGAEDDLRTARAVLARWGNYPVKPDSSPIPTAERWPEFSDCDPQERVWAWNPFLDHWKLSCINRSVHTHWLPANALPVPADD